MADRKTMTRQTLIGEKGIELISRRCLQMGYLFHPRRVDHGIDGHIDLVEASTGAVLNLTLLVQSKAQDRPFPGETAEAFRYLCDQRDLDMWLSGNAPVILVFSHPEQEEAWWVEVKTAFPDAAARAKRTTLIDKKTQRFDQDAAAALMDLALPKDAGLYLRPPSITETLTTNLLRVAEMPASVFVATSRFGGDYRAAGEALAERGMRASGWMLRDGMVFSFGDLREEPGSILCEGDVEEARPERPQRQNDQPQRAAGHRECADRVRSAKGRRRLRGGDHLPRRGEPRRRPADRPPGATGRRRTPRRAAHPARVAVGTLQRGASPLREFPRPAQGAAAAPAPADPDHPAQQLGRGVPASRRLRSAGRGQPRVEPARRSVLQGRRRALAAAAQPDRLDDVLRRCLLLPQLG